MLLPAKPYGCTSPLVGLSPFLFVLLLGNLLSILWTHPATAQRACSDTASADLSTSQVQRSEVAPNGLHCVIALDLEDAPLAVALRQISQKAGLRLTYSSALLPKSERVTLRARQIPVAAAMAHVLRSTDLELVTTASGHAAIVRRRPTTRDPAREREQAAVTGRVIDASSREPLAGAVIMVAGTPIATVTGPDGEYSLSHLPEGTLQLRSDRLSYLAEERTVALGQGQSVTADFELRPHPIALEGIVAVGYGTQQRRYLTGAVASAKVDDVPLVTAPTVAQMLQGRAAGVLVMQNSGAPGAGLSVRIRGTNSINANSEPLYVVDGIPAAQGTTSQDPLTNPLITLDPSDIESIQILKDAASTAIYGSRGANGVVLITTRRGHRGGDRIRMESTFGMQRVSRTIPVLNAQQYMELANESFTNIGQAAPYTPQQIQSAQSYDYPSMMLRSAPQQSHALTLSGGDEKTRYLIGANYLQQDGIMLGSDFQRVGVRLNLDREFSSRFRLGNSLSLTRINQSSARADNASLGTQVSGILAAMQFEPMLSPRDEHGNWRLQANIGPQMENPVANVHELIDDRNQWRAVGNLFGEFELREGIRLRSTLGANASNQWNPFFAPRTVLLGAPTNGSARVFSSQELQLTNENTVTLQQRPVGPGRLDMLGGFSVQTSDYRSTLAAAQNFPSDALRFNNLGAGATMQPASSQAVQWTLLSWLGRANYNLLDKYLFTLTGRYDGSSRFGANNKWALFPSAAFAWRVIDEPFLREQQLLSDLKLRLSYGRTGNQAIEEYQSLARLSNSFYAFGPGGTEFAGTNPAGVAPNPDLKWETQDQFNAGVDLGFLQNRLTLTVDAYQSNTSNLLLVFPLPSASGYAAQLRNVGAVRNRGVELALSTTNVETERFGWRSTLNVSGNRNQVTDLGGLPEILPVLGPRNNSTGDARLFVEGERTHVVRQGQPLGAIYGFQVNGLYQQGDACELINQMECAPGEYKVTDLNGDGRIDLSDRQILGYADPKLFGGFNNSLRYGPLSLDAYLSFSYGNQVVNLSKVYGELVTGFTNERATVLNRWTPQNPNTTIPRANNLRPVRLYSTLMEDGSFLRLQTLTLGYQLPQGLLPGTSSSRLFLTGQNLWVLTGYSGFDPEVNSAGGDARLRGIDLGAYPRARVWNLGANVTF